MKKPLLFILQFLLTISHALAQGDYDIYLMIGQSNCAGRGYMLPSDTTDIIPGVWLLNDEGLPEPAKAPFNRYSNIRKDISMQKIGPAVGFAPLMHELTGRNILIIQNAKGGSGLWEWQNEDDPDAITFLDSTLMRAVPALKYGKLKGIVWHQGETDVSNGSARSIYVTRFSHMIQRLRNSLDVGEEVPVIVGELGQWEWEKMELIDTFNDVTLPRLTKMVPNCHKVESDGLECRSKDHSDPHFSRESNIELGRRYAQAMIKALAGSSEEEYRQTINKENDMNNLRNAITETLEEMAKKAKSMNMQGVAVASVLSKETEVDWIGEMKVVDTPYNPDGGDKGWNLVAIAWSKAGEVIASGADSGNPERKCMTGELNYTGGAYDESTNYKYAFAFSGGLSEDDYAVAKFGISYLKALLGE